MKEQNDFYALEEVLDELVGVNGTSEREAHDMCVELALIGYKVKELRESKNYTQKQLGELIGVQAAQICKIEKGQNLSIANVSRIFKALGVEVQLILETNLSIEPQVVHTS